MKFQLTTMPRPAELEDCTDEGFAVIFSGRHILLNREAPFLPTSSVLKQFDITPLAIGTSGENQCYAIDLPTEPSILEEKFQLPELRFALGALQQWEYDAVSRARHLLTWYKTHRYCGACGKPTRMSDMDIAIVCPECNTRFYPQLAPAVIVAVTREDKILLAHNSRFVSGVYGLIAGFVEAGESAEQAIHREIMEETGIEVTDIRYLTSQSWPFPNSLMLGFQAKYKAGEAHADGEELTDLGWFTADTLPSIPQPGSVARKIIDDFLKGNLK